ncbi:MAG: phage holin family protein [Desulfovibrionaceae bacterium]
MPDYIQNLLDGHHIQSFLDQLIVLFFPVSIAIVGGLVRAFHERRCSLRRIAVGVVTSGFTGLLLALFCEYMQIVGPLQGVICGVGGFAGGDLLISAARKFCEVVERRDV